MGPALGVAPLSKQAESAGGVSLGMGEKEVPAEAASGWDSVHLSPRALNTCPPQILSPWGKPHETQPSSRHHPPPPTPTGHATAPPR